MQKIPIVTIALLLFYAGDVGAQWVDYCDWWGGPYGNCCRRLTNESACVPPLGEDVECTYYFSTQGCCCEGLVWAPDAPSNVTTTLNGNSILIQWDEDPTATQYTLWWGKRPAITLGEDNRFIMTDNSFTHRNLEYDQKYYYYLKASNKYGGDGTDFSATTGANPDPGTPPPAPDNFTATSSIYTQGGKKLIGIELHWNHVPAKYGYHIYWSKQPGVTRTQFDGKIDTGDRMYLLLEEDPGKPLEYNTTYYFIITAENTIGEGAPSDEIQVTTVHLPVIAPVISIILG
jgi:hypothetical protein